MEFLTGYLGKENKMISPLPWTLDEHDPAKIFSAEGDVIAENYTFLDMDDFEAICELVNQSEAGRARFAAGNDDEINR